MKGPNRTKREVGMWPGVALITPMKRGLKVKLARLVAAELATVALITPMKRGLKGDNS